MFSFLLGAFKNIYFCVCLSMCALCAKVHKEVRRWHWIPWSWNWRQLWVIWYKSWELNSGFPDEQQLPLMAEPSLLLHFENFIQAESYQVKSPLLNIPLEIIPWYIIPFKMRTVRKQILACMPRPHPTHSTYSLLFPSNQLPVPRARQWTLPSLLVFSGPAWELYIDRSHQVKPPSLSTASPLSLQRLCLVSHSSLWIHGSLLTNSPAARHGGCSRFCLLQAMVQRFLRSCNTWGKKATFYSQPTSPPLPPYSIPLKYLAWEWVSNKAATDYFLIGISQHSHQWVSHNLTKRLGFSVLFCK